MTWFLCLAVPSTGPLGQDVFLAPGQWFLTQQSNATAADTAYRTAAGYGPDVRVLVVPAAQVMP